MIIKTREESLVSLIGTARISLTRNWVYRLSSSLLQIGLDDVLSSASRQGDEASTPPVPTSVDSPLLSPTSTKVTFVPTAEQIFYSRARISLCFCFLHVSHVIVTLTVHFFVSTLLHSFYLHHFFTCLQKHQVCATNFRLCTRLLWFGRKSMLYSRFVTTFRSEYNNNNNNITPTTS